MRRLLAERVARWPPGWLRNSGSAWDVDAHSDGAVAVQLIMSDRTEGDARAIAIHSARVYVDPMRVTTDLRDARADIKQALIALRETPDESSQLASLIPFTPRRTLKRLADAALADPDRPVVCSNLGDLGWLVIRLDGTAAEYASSRADAGNTQRDNGSSE